jgi:hypothetical protein
MATVDDMYEAECYDHEINMLLDQIKEEFFDNRIRMYKLTKFGLIKLLPFVKSDKTLEFLQTIKRESTVVIKV